MTLKIIVGTLFDITDPTGQLLDLYRRGVFLRYVWDGEQWTSYNPGIISFTSNGEKVNVVQETGAGKTILLSVFAYRSHMRGRKIAGNIGFEWTLNNLGKDKKEWTPALKSIEDIEKANNVDLEIDDVYGTITAWNCDEASFIRTAALIARKSFVNINFTAQFTTNQIPPDLRRITGEYHIPFIRAVRRDEKAPDGHDTPLEIIDLRFNGFFQYKGYNVYNLQSETGKKIMNGFDTLEVSTALKTGDSCENNLPGWPLECEALEHLKPFFPFDKDGNTVIKHPVHKTFDLYTPTHLFDVMGLDEDGNGISDHKTWTKLIGAARRTNKIPYLMFKWGDGWGLIRIKPDLPEGKRFNFSDSSIFRRIRTLESIFMPESIKPSQTIPSV